MSDSLTINEIHKSNYLQQHRTSKVQGYNVFWDPEYHLHTLNISVLNLWFRKRNTNELSIYKIITTDGILHTHKQVI